MYELILNNEVVDKAPLANLEQARVFFIKRKRMTSEQFDKLGYSVRVVEPKQIVWMSKQKETLCQMQQQQHHQQQLQMLTT